jgi:phosphoesterase RecJ-like protein
MSSAAAVAAELARHHSIVIASHARPDGDAVGSQVALGLALTALGKSVRLVARDPVPAPYLGFPAIDRIERVTAVGPADAVVILECSDITRPELDGLNQAVVVNVDHHLGNQMYGTLNWFDGTAAACGEMVADIIDRLGVRWTADIAAQLYLAISTDTGSFRYGPISARTFDVCARIQRAGVDTARLSRAIFDSFGIGRVKLTGALLAAMDLRLEGRLAILAFDAALLSATGATVDDTEGLVNIPLGAREVAAAALFKEQAGGRWRVSLRSKGEVDVRRVALVWQGGGHTNAAGCTVTADLATAKDLVTAEVARALEPPAPGPRAR